MSDALEAFEISTFRKWKENQLNEIKRRGDELLAKLQAVIPASLTIWATESVSCISDLIKYGVASRKYSYKEGDIYGYTDLEEFAKLFDQLRGAWPGVDIEIIWEEDGHRFEVIFRIS